MWQWLSSGRGFHLGRMFEQAATRHGAVTVTLDRPLDAAGTPDTRYTYRRLAELVDDLARQLWAAGVRPSERVAIHKTDNFDIALLACAAARIGAVPALLSPGLDGEIVGTLLGRLRRPWLVADEAKLAGSLAPLDIATLTRKTLVVGNAPAGTVALGKFAGASPVDAVRSHPGEPSLITHSSGTTGIPKLAVHCPATLWNRLVPQKAMAWPLRGETAAFCMSFVHSRFYHSLGVFLAGGSPLLMLTDPDPAKVGPLLAKARPGVVETHPNTFVLWEELADAPGAPLANVRCYGSTFDAIHPRTVQRLLGASRRHGRWLIQLYGQSETGPITARIYTPRGAGRASGRLVGVSLPGFTRVRIVDDQGNPCRRGTVGHIEALTRGRILGYLGGEQQYARQSNGRWWRMGDMGQRGRWGGLYLIDREIDQIESVDSNLEVEDTLMSRLPELREIVLIPDDAGRPIPVVCTRDDRPLAGRRWHDAVADLPAMADPVQWRFDDLPRTSTWKIRRVALAEMLAAEPVAVHG